ncbi:kinesin light chain [Pyricularia oryzae]|uniref:Uncharacterized protein n=1 Tax=Pyricularia grisea TaxID=148305 RepID=A0A6P8BM96_PYRGI|nr:uncharacterized protein PgNI_01126 [Pyricularia grisea]KAI7912772.1 kinesin light chain [Pyricularia oryzae]TLD17928.1 hypothetical protein PgNI_01126 [Pyricularia grisea]
MTQANRVPRLVTLRYVGDAGGPPPLCEALKSNSSWRLRGLFLRTGPRCLWFSRSLYEVLGPENPFSFMTMNNLGFLLGSPGKHEEAVQMHRKTLALRQKVLGLESPSTFNSINNLASVLDRQGTSSVDTLFAANHYFSGRPTDVFPSGR